MQVSIETERFNLRELTKDDVTEHYLNWFNNEEANKYIYYAAEKKIITDLKQYVTERIGRDDILFLGIYDRNLNLHIGNIKYEPINTKLGYAVMGILIGEPDYRGKGVTVEVVNASSQWLKKNHGINKIVLGVCKNNHAAICAYKNAGFVLADVSDIICEDSENITMVCYL
jgi:RimJ/RimL family protein N-acetyltransferase